MNFYQNSIVNNCEYYASFDKNVGCVKCKVGYQGLVSKDKFISQCDEMTKCLKKEIYGVSKNIN